MCYNQYKNEIIQIISIDNMIESVSNNIMYDFEATINKIKYNKTIIIYATITKINNCEYKKKININDDIILHPDIKIKKNLLDLPFDNVLQLCNVYLKKHIEEHHEYPAFLTAKTDSWKLHIKRL